MTLASLAIDADVLAGIAALIGYLELRFKRELARQLAELRQVVEEQQVTS